MYGRQRRVRRLAERLRRAEQPGTACWVPLRGQHACQPLEALCEPWGVANLLAELQALDEERRRLGSLSPGFGQFAEVGKYEGDALFVPQVLGKGKRLAVQGLGLIEVALVLQDLGQVAEREGDSLGVAQLPPERQALFIVGRRPPVVLSQECQGTQAVQPDADAASVPKLAGPCHTLGEKRCCPSVVSLGKRDIAEVVERGGDASLVPSLAEKRQRLLQEFARATVVAPIVVRDNA